MPADNHDHVFNRLNWRTDKLHTAIITLNFFLVLEGINDKRNNTDLLSAGT